MNKQQGIRLIHEVWSVHIANLLSELLRLFLRVRPHPAKLQKICSFFGETPFYPKGDLNSARTSYHFINTDPPFQEDSEFEIETGPEQIASRTSDLIFGRK
jgi:hypothetical protein